MKTVAPRLEPHVVDALARVGRVGNLGKLAARLDEVLREGISRFSNVPAKIEFRLLTTRLQDLGPDKRKAIVFLFAESAGWAGAFSQVHTLRAREMLLEIVSGLNEQRYTRVAFSARSLIETAAIASCYAKDQAKNCAFLSAMTVGKLRRVSKSLNGDEVDQLGAAWTELRETMTRGRFKWGATDWVDLAASYKVDPKTSKHQVNVLTAIQKLQFDEMGLAGGTAMFWFELLSDFVHPNFGASVLKIREFARESKFIARHVYADPVPESDVGDVLVSFLMPPISNAVRIIDESLQPFRKAHSKATEVLASLG